MPWGEEHQPPPMTSARLVAASAHRRAAAGLAVAVDVYTAHPTTRNQERLAAARDALRAAEENLDP